MFSGGIERSQWHDIGQIFPKFFILSNLLPNSHLLLFYIRLKRCCEFVTIHLGNTVPTA